MLRKIPHHTAPAAQAFVLHRQATTIDTRGMPAHQFVTMAQTAGGEQPNPTRPLAEAFAEDAALLGIEPMAGWGLGPLRTAARRTTRRTTRRAALLVAATAVLGMYSAFALIRMLPGN